MHKATGARGKEGFKTVSNLTDLLTLALNVIFIFATVSFVSSAATDGLFALFQVAQGQLLAGVKELLNDQAFKGLARAIYNSVGVNPRATGTAQSVRELRSKPAKIDPDAFAVTLLELLHVVPSPITSSADGDLLIIPPDLQPVEGVTEQDRVDNAISNASRIIALNVPAQNAVPNPDGTRKPDAAREMTRLIVNMIQRHRADRQDMEKAVSAWFQFGMAHVTDSFRNLTKLANFLIAFVIAILLNLKPIPVGGFSAALIKSAAPSGVSISDYLPILISIFEWSVVATSTLLGAQFWFSILKVAVAAGQPKGATQPQVPPAAAVSSAATGSTAKASETGTSPPSSPPGASSPP